MTPSISRKPLQLMLHTEARCNQREVQIGELPAHASTHTRRNRLYRDEHTTRRRSYRHSRSYRCARACLCSHSRLPATLTTHANPTLLQLPPSSPSTSDEVWNAHGTLPRVLPHALDGASLGSISAPPQHAHCCPESVRDHPIAPSKHRRQRQRTHTARARATPSTRP